MFSRLLFSAGLLAGLFAPAVAQDAGATYSTTRQKVAVSIDGEPVRLQMVIHQPLGSGPFPTLVFHHGSTGYGLDETRFGRDVDAPAVAHFFLERGWAVVLPARRGRGGSEGRYDEGFSVPRALGYSCIPSLSLAGADRALRDMEAAMQAIRGFPFVDTRRVLIGGQSRGGALSVAYAGAHPDEVVGVVNFVGGWLGWPCPTMSWVNKSLMRRGGSYPGRTLWLYADGDPYYSLSHSRGNLEAFVAAGGRAEWHQFQLDEPYGHRLVTFPDLWGPALDAWLRGLDAAEALKPGERRVP